uniref:PAS domain-containing sensor histidine kinase n=1 Tax=Mucilaginibacter sp. Bleaf8 TaxID=2834430 RepID=UPI001BCB1245|nr:PAS domain-containing sensor histidine kinase [Mucilaginibacter sp. Bleaf8]
MHEAQLDIFRQMGALSNDVYFVFDTAAIKFIYVSKAFETIWAMPADTVLYSPLSLLKTIHQEDKQDVMDSYHEFKQEQKARKFEFRIQLPNETLKYIRLSVYPIQDGDAVNFTVGIAEDITVLKRNIFYMEKINARKNSSLEILAHDLKGPLGMISMLASGIERETIADNKNHILQSVQMIQDMCKRNIALIGNIVQQEFSESIEVELRKERADLVWEINDVVQNYKKHEDDLAKTFTLHSTVPKLYIAIDSLKFMQVINNLISNAIKFTPDNGVIELTIQDLQRSALIMVRDNGIGIPANMHPYLFERFTRARRNGLHGEEPVGLGMSIIKTIVELHGGKIWFESQEGEGSTFYIEIPK